MDKKLASRFRPVAPPRIIEGAYTEDQHCYLVGLVRECLERCVNGPPECRVEKLDFPLNPPKPFTYHGRVQVLSGGRPVTVGMTATTATHATSAAGALRRLAEDAAPPARVLLVTDERVGLPMGNQPNAQGRVYLNQLEDRTPNRFRHVTITADQYAELDAFVHVIAHTDDLDVPGRTRTEKEMAVVESLLRRARFRAHPLLAQLLSDPRSAATPEPPADDRMLVGAGRRNGRHTDAAFGHARERGRRGGQRQNVDGQGAGRGSDPPGRAGAGD